MSALDSMLPVAGPAPAGGGGMAVAPATSQTGGEAFDQVMSRTLAPAEAAAPVEANPSSASRPLSTDGKPLATGGPAPRKRVPTHQAPSAVPVAGAEDAGEPVVIQPSDVKAGRAPSTSEADPAATKDPASLPSPKAADDGFGGWLSVMAQPVIPPMPEVRLPLSAVAEKQGSLYMAAKTAAGMSGQTGPVLDKQGETLSAGTQPAGRPGASAKSDRTVAEKITASAPAIAKGLAPEDKKPEIATKDSPLSATKPELTVPLPAKPVSASPESNQETPAPPQSENFGTVVAKLYSSMNKRENVNKVAGLAGKTGNDLPGDATSAAPGNILSATGSMAHFSSADKNPGSGIASSQEVVSATPVNALRTQSLERTHELIAMHALRSAEGGQDSMRVVIKPGEGLQMALELRQHGDAMDVQVRLQHGDFNQLNQHWPELQQRLEERGIRLAPLTQDEPTAFNAGTGGFQPPARETAVPELLPAGGYALPGISSATTTTTATATATSAGRRGWETWA